MSVLLPRNLFPEREDFEIEVIDVVSDIIATVSDDFERGSHMKSIYHGPCFVDGCWSQQELPFVFIHRSECECPKCVDALEIPILRDTYSDSDDSSGSYIEISGDSGSGTGSGTGSDVEMSCGTCLHQDNVIASRGMGGEDYLITCDEAWSRGYYYGNAALHAAMESGYICMSCSVGGHAGGGVSEGDIRECHGFYCVDCGFSEILSMQYHGVMGSFYDENNPRPDRMDQYTRCTSCKARVDRWNASEQEEQEEQEGGEQEGGEQREQGEREQGEQEEGEISAEEREEQEEWSALYDSEFEVYDEETEPTENSQETVKEEVIDIVKGMGEILFDIQGKITDGEYLILMDSLQGITNKMGQWIHYD